MAALAGLGAALAPVAGQADNLIDHRVNEDSGGVYSAQDALPIALGLATGGCALWIGTEDRLGRTCWESGEAAVASGLLAKGLQHVFRREAPNQTADANHWFSSDSTGSFPSTHVAFTTAIVTPVIFQYVDEDPWVAALALLPAYEMVARVKAREHWQTDVLAGAALGFGIGWYEQRRDHPLSLYVLPGGGFVGFQKSF